MGIIKHFKNEPMSEYLDKVVLSEALGVTMSLAFPESAKEYGTIKNGDFEVKDSGERREFDSGAVRDKASGKGRFDLIPAYPLHRLAKLYEAGAIKYADRNWEKGMPTGQFMDSAFRHLMNYQDGDRSEDHLTAVVWNIFGLIWTQEQIKRGKLPESLLTLPEPKEMDGTTQDVPF